MYVLYGKFAFGGALFYSFVSSLGGETGCSVCAVAASAVTSDACTESAGAASVSASVKGSVSAVSSIFAGAVLNFLATRMKERELKTRIAAAMTIAISANTNEL